MKNSQLEKISEFKQTIFDFYQSHERLLPWRETQDPYRITVSEIMLQQTQAERVIPKYELFIQKLPSWKELAEVPSSELIMLWQGLGYNRRALALKKMAQEVQDKYKGKLPADRELLVQLPGIGPYTSGAIMAFAFNQPVTLIETNIRRVFLSHFFAAQEDIPDNQIFPLIEETVDQENPREWYYALMDYGAMLGKKGENANRRSKHYTKQGPLKGSNREVRGVILRILSQNGPLPFSLLVEQTEISPERISPAYTQLLKEGFIVEDTDQTVTLA